MKIQVAYRNIDKERRKPIDALLKELREALERLLSAFDQEAVHLHVALQKHGRRDLYRVALELKLPRKTLVAEEENEDPYSVLRKAFSELERLVKKYKSLLKNEPLWKRKTRRAQLHAALKEGRPAEDEQQRRQSYMALLRPHLDELYNFARREIAYLHATGELTADDIGPQELVDAALVRGYEQYTRRPSQLEIEHWMYQLMLEILTEEIARIRAEHDLALSTEEAPPPEPEETMDMRDAETFAFSHPEESIRLEDLIPKPDSVPPDEQAEQEELRLNVHRVLASLPRLWRQVLVLSDMQGLKADAVTEILGIDEERPSQIHACASELIRERLVELGLAESRGTVDTRGMISGAAGAVPLPAAVGDAIRERFS